MSDRVAWGDDSLCLGFEWSSESPPRLADFTMGTGAAARFDGGLPLVEILTVGHGHAPANDRLVHTRIGRSLRYRSHHEYEGDGRRTLELTMAAEAAGLSVQLRLVAAAGNAAFQAQVTVTNDGDRPATLRSVTSWLSPLGYSPASSAGPDFDAWVLRSGRSDWLAEGRWDDHPLRGPEFPKMAQHLTGHDPRGAHAAISCGTWSTGSHLPVAGLEAQALQLAWIWQIEHNGAWRWEIGENSSDGYLALSGPTDVDHAWSVRLEPGESFMTVPVGIAVGRSLDEATIALTQYRRTTRRPHPDNDDLPVVFNDYMNTLVGDPTTERLLPLIDAAAEVGAEIFCIDAGWYDETGSWWDTVGEWLPSSTRFPGGFLEVVDHIRARGMVPGLWVEPEVVGVRSPAAVTLPDEAFFLRHGERMVEHDRFHLDLRHPAAVAHLDEVIDRLVGDYGIGYFKLDYNIDPGGGTDRDADSSGAGLLDHNRGHAAWLDSVLDRHPRLVLENCASGAMRMDWAMLSRLQLQSTSDQQNFLNYPPIAASAPLSMLPEQAASWAYPQPEMADEEVAFTLATSVLGRFYLSGHLDRMSKEQRDLVAEAVAANKSIRERIACSSPFWPGGIPQWDAPWVALGLRCDDSLLVTVWSREPAESLRLELPELTGSPIEVRTLFPTRLTEWQTKWDAESGALSVTNPTTDPAARTFEIRW